MTAYLNAYLRLALLKQNPQDLPASQTLTLLSLASYFLISIALSAPGYGLGKGMVHAVIEVMILIAYTRGLLSAFAIPERFMQTVSALAGCSVLWGIAVLPLGALLAQAPPEEPPAGPALLYFALVIWLLVVYGHIFRHALSRGSLGGFLAGLGYLIAASIASSLLFGLPQS